LTKFGSNLDSRFINLGSTPIAQQSRPWNREIGSRSDEGNTIMKKFLPLLLVVAAIYLYQGINGTAERPVAEPVTAAAPRASRVSSGQTGGPLIDGRQAQGSGTVTRVLSDDNDGSRHQRFILQLGNGRTLLIAHNIDLAPRINGIREGDKVEFFGEFRSNPQGGVIHWTHRDPQGRHPGGWLRHKGRIYE
jgi:hypothetical protein